MLSDDQKTILNQRYDKAFQERSVCNEQMMIISKMLLKAEGKEKKQLQATFNDIKAKYFSENAIIEKITIKLRPRQQIIVNYNSPIKPTTAQKTALIRHLSITAETYMIDVFKGANKNITENESVV